MTECGSIMDARVDHVTKKVITYTMEEMLALRNSECSTVKPAYFESQFITAEGRFSPEAWFDHGRKGTRSRAASEPRERKIRAPSGGAGPRHGGNRPSTGQERKSRSTRGTKKQTAGAQADKKGKESQDPVPLMADGDKENINVGKQLLRLIQEGPTTDSKPVKEKEKRVRVVEDPKPVPKTEQDELDALSSVLRQVILGKKQAAPRLGDVNDGQPVEVESVTPLTPLNVKKPSPPRASEKHSFYRLLHELRAEMEKRGDSVESAASACPPSPTEPPSPLLSPRESQYLRYQHWLGPLLACQIAQAVPVSNQNIQSPEARRQSMEALRGSSFENQINHLPVAGGRATTAASPVATTPTSPPRASASSSQPEMVSPSQVAALFNQSHVAYYYRLAQLAAAASSAQCSWQKLEEALRTQIAAATVASVRPGCSTHLISSGYLPGVSPALVSRYMAHQENLAAYLLNPNQLLRSDLMASPKSIHD